MCTAGSKQKTRAHSWEWGTLRLGAQPGSSCSLGAFSQTGKLLHSASSVLSCQPSPLHQGPKRTQCQHSGTQACLGLIVSGALTEGVLGGTAAGRGGALGGGSRGGILSVCGAGGAREGKKETARNGLKGREQ